MPRLLGCIPFVLVLTLLSPVTAQESPAAPSESTRATVEAKRAALSKLEREHARAEGDRRAILADEVAGARDELSDALESLIAEVDAARSAGADIKGLVAAGEKALTTELEAITKELRALARSIDALRRDTKDDADAESVRQAELTDSELRYQKVIERYTRAVEQLGRLGADPKKHSLALDTLLTERAETLRGTYKLALARKDEVAKMPSSSDDEKKARDKRAGEVDAQIAGIRKAYENVLDLLEDRGIEVKEHRQFLIEATGEITTDVFDADVASGLAQRWIGKARDWLVNDGPRLAFKILLFLLVLGLFRFLAGVARRLVRKGLKSSRLKLSSLLREFFEGLVAKIVFLLGVLIALSQLGFELGPVLAGLGVIGFIVGFALQSTLSNFAAGLMILVYRPYDVGDLVEVAGAFGTVSEMTLVSTTILTLDNQKLVVPNSKVWDSVIRNVTAEPTRRVDLTFGISYADDIDKAREILEDIVTSHKKVLEKPESTVKLHVLGESSVDFVVRPWCKTEDYWDVYWDVTRTVKQRFDAAEISIPFPQRDVHLYNHDKA